MDQSCEYIEKLVEELKEQSKAVFKSVEEDEYNKIHVSLAALTDRGNSFRHVLKVIPLYFFFPRAFPVLFPFPIILAFNTVYESILRIIQNLNLIFLNRHGLRICLIKLSNPVCAQYSRMFSRM